MRRTAVLGTSVLLAAGIGAGGAAAADATVQLNDSVHASTTLAKLHQTVVIPPGTFKGYVDADTGALRGTLALPAAKTTVSLAGIGLATATFTIVPTKATTGKVNFSTYKLAASATFNIHVDSVTPLGTSLNLVGSKCTTATPVTLAFGGTVAFFGDSSVSGTYTIPALAHCGLSTVALNAVLSGTGNTFNATLSPY